MQILPIIRIVRIEAVDHNAIASGFGSRMAVPPLPKIHGNMSREKQKISRLDTVNWDFMDGKALHNFGIPIDLDAAEHIGHGTQPGAVDPHGRLSAPAVMGSPVGQHRFRQGTAKRPFLCTDRGRPIRPQDPSHGVAPAAVCQLNLLPTLFRRTQGNQPAAQGQGLHDPALNLRLLQNITEILMENHLIHLIIPVFRSFLIQKQVIGTGDSLISVVGTHMKPTGNHLIQNFHHHAVEDFVHHAAFPGGLLVQLAHRNIHDCFHRITCLPKSPVCYRHPG